jgi:glyoxylase-like metal-dependent hydrolase (beta-lactamase superfamily II)
MSFPESEGPAPRRRAFLATAAAAAALPVSASLLGSTSVAAAADSSPDLPDYAPVPPNALGPALNANGYFVGRIKRNLYWITSNGYVAAFLTTRDGVVLFDAPPGIGGNIQRAVNEVAAANGTSNKITHLVYSHFHADHIGASALFGKHVTRIGHSETHTLLKRQADPARPVPDVTFEDRYTLHVGGERVELAYHGPSHTLDSIFIHLPHHDTLMLVDVVIPAWVPFAAMNVSEHIPGFLDAHAAALSYRFQHFIGGHIRLGARTDISLQQQYLDDMTASAKHAIDTVDRTPFAQRYPDNGWAVTKTYFDALVAATSAPVIQKYTGVLAGADVYTDSNAFVLLESLRLESGYGSTVRP